MCSARGDCSFSARLPPENTFCMCVPRCMCTRSLGAACSARAPCLTACSCTSCEMGTRFKKSLLLLQLLDFFGSIFSRNFSLTISHCLQFSPEQERLVEPHVSGQEGGGSALRQHGCGYLVHTAAKRSPSEKGVCLGAGLPLSLKGKTTQDWVTGTVGAVFFWAWEQDLGVTPGWSSECAVAYSCA